MSLRLWLTAVVLSMASQPLLAVDPDVVRIGMTDSLMQETPLVERVLLAPEFSELVRDFTGLKNVILPGLDPFAVARQLESGKWHLGVVQGVEFAWLKAKHPGLKPLMVTGYKPQVVRALLLVKKEDAITGFADLKGKDIFMLQSKLHCQLFGDKEARGKVKDYFGKVLESRSVEDALDELLRGKVQAAIVDTTQFEVYKKLQPGRFARLRVVVESDPFPPTAIVYHGGTLSDPMLDAIRAGMLKANQTDRGRETMASFHIASFQAVPADYSQRLADILKAYPAPK